MSSSVSFAKHSMTELSASSENEPLVALIAVAGLPGCGKSSFCKALISHITTLQRSSNLPKPFDSASWHYICYDSVEAELRDSKCDFDPVVWKASREKVVELVSGLSNFSDNAEATTRTCAHNRVILLDDNMYYRSMRKKMVSLRKGAALRVSSGFIVCSCGGLRGSKRVKTSIQSGT